MGKAAFIWRNPEVTRRYLPFVEPYFAPDGYIHDIAVTLDTASPALIGEGWTGKVDLRIDHHPSDAGYAGLEYTDPSAAACGEVVHELLTALGVQLTQEIAVPLYVAIVTDTGCFRYSNTSAKTHRCAADLVDTGIDIPALNCAIFAKSRLRLSVESAMSRRIEYHAGGQVAVASLSLLEKGDASEDDLENLTGLVQSIAGVKVVLILREYPSGWRISCRSVEPYAANLVCAVLGGGGHARAAGADIKEPMTQEGARLLALETLWNTYPELR
jgi:phosphoesterase RecJ-like protein